MPDFQNVNVVGAGLMGHGIALVHALGGCNVRLHDTSAEQLDWAMQRIESLSGELCDLGMLRSEERRTVVERVTASDDLSACARDADLVVEAIVENAEAKKAFFAELAPIMHPDAVLASNTSFLNVFPLVPAALLPRTMIVHWYTPPYLVDLVDVVGSDVAPAQLADRMVAFLQSLGKRPVKLKKFVPGYLANNIQMAIESEIFRLLDDGIADAMAIDEAIRYGIAQRLCLMGHFKKIDYTGLEVVRDIHATGDYVPPAQPTGTPDLDERISAGATGVLAGRGFYDYSDTPPATYFKRRDRKLAMLRNFLATHDGDPL